jgi:hypothetical protein
VYALCAVQRCIDDHLKSPLATYFVLCAVAGKVSKYSKNAKFAEKNMWGAKRLVHVHAPIRRAVALCIQEKTNSTKRIKAHSSRKLLPNSVVVYANDVPKTTTQFSKCTTKRNGALAVQTKLPILSYFVRIAMHRTTSEGVCITIKK